MSIELEEVLVLRVSSLLNKLRNTDIDEVVDSSHYLTDQMAVDPRRAYFKAIQAIRRDPRRDRTNVIDESELAALAVVRTNLGQMHWRVFRDEQVRDLVHRRIKSGDLQLVRNHAYTKLAGSLECRTAYTGASFREFIKACRMAPRSSARQALALLGLLIAYDRGPTPPKLEPLIGVASSCLSGKTVKLAYFACLNPASDKAFSRMPHEYVPWHYSGQRLTWQRSQLIALMSDLEFLEIDYHLTIFLADTDATEYVYPVRGGQIDREAYRSRLAEHCCDLVRQQDWMAPFALTVRRWSSVDGARECRTLHELGNEPRLHDIAQEIQFLADEFGAAEDGAGPELTIEDLKRMAYLKCAMYGQQGRRLVELTPDTVPILLQGERPEARRNRMYSSLLAQGQQLAIICPWVADAPQA